MTASRRSFSPVIAPSRRSSTTISGPIRASGRLERGLSAYLGLLQELRARRRVDLRDVCERLHPGGRRRHREGRRADAAGRGNDRRARNEREARAPEDRLLAFVDGRRGRDASDALRADRFELQSMGGKAAAQWNDHLLSAENSLLFSVLPVGWIGDWHENPKPQWIAPLSGRWFVEIDGRHPRGDGARRSRLRRRSEREAGCARPGRPPLRHGRR